jgi:hypothetical protein
LEGASCPFLSQWPAGLGARQVPCP